MGILIIRFRRIRMNAKIFVSIILIVLFLGLNIDGHLIGRSIQSGFEFLRNLD